MKTTFNSILELANKFSTDAICRAYLADKLWNGKPVCPHCANEEVYSFKDGRRYKCKTCKKQFTVTVGTIFEGSHIPLQKWFIGAYLLTAHKKGISSLQLSRDLDITQKSAWYMLHRLRYTARSKSFLMPLNGIVEMDETYVGGWERNRHASKKGIKVKKPVFGMLQRNGEVRTQMVKDAQRETLMPIIHANIAKGTALVTDQATVYFSLREKFPHFSVNHHQGEYVRGKIHTNTIENFWSLFKRGYIGTYHMMSEKHLDKYLDEFEFRYNTKKATEQNRFDSMLVQSSGYLSYKGLIGKK